MKKRILLILLAIAFVVICFTQEEPEPNTMAIQTASEDLTEWLQDAVNDIASNLEEPED